MITFAGGIYSVSPGTWTVDGLTYSYQWQVNGVNGIGTDGNSVVGSTSSTYIPDGSESGPLTVIVTVTRTGFTDAAPVTVMGRRSPRARNRIDRSALPLRACGTVGASDTFRAMLASCAQLTTRQSR